MSSMTKPQCQLLLTRFLDMLVGQIEASAALRLTHCVDHIGRSSNRRAGIPNVNSI
jgi:hypothetical protein